MDRLRPPFVVDHFSWLDRSDQNGPLHLTFPTHSQSQSVLSMYNMEENTYHCSFYRLLTADFTRTSMRRDNSYGYGALLWLFRVV